MGFSFSCHFFPLGNFSAPFADEVARWNVASSDPDVRLPLLYLDTFLKSLKNIMIMGTTTKDTLWSLFPWHPLASLLRVFEPGGGFTYFLFSPDSEHGISDPDGHNEPGSFGSTDGPDDLVGPKSEAEDDDGATMTTTFEKWLLYRPNPFGRDQLLFCAIRIDPNDPATSFVIGVNSCWPRIDANGLQHIEVHNSVMRSSSRKGADKVYVGDDRIDGRNAVIGPRRVVTEVQIHYGGSLFTVDSQARYVGRRSDFDTIFRGEPWIDKCRRDPTMTCFGFVNGANRPWRSITVYDDGDFVEVQVLSSEEPSASTELRHYQEDDEDLFDRAVEPSTNCASSSHVAFLDPIESVVFRPRDEVPGLAPYWSFSAHPDDGQEQFAIALRHCWPDLDDSTRWSLLIPHDTWRTSLALTAWRAAYIIDHTVDRKPGHALILVEFRRADRPPTAAHVRAEWVLALISPGLLTQFLDREGECAQPGRHCQFSLNNRPYFGYDSIPFAHGDYVLIEVVETDAQMIVVYKPQSKHGSTIWRRYWDFGLIICLDFLAFILTFAVLSYVRKPRSHKLCKVGLTRHAVHGRRPKTKACWRIACFVYLLTSAESLPLSQRASQVVYHDLDHTAATDFGFPSSRLIGCKHDGEAPTASALIPVSIPEFAFQGQQLRQPRMTFVGDVDLQNAVTRLSDIAPAHLFWKPLDSMMNQLAPGRSRSTRSLYNIFVPLFMPPGSTIRVVLIPGSYMCSLNPLMLHRRSSYS